MNTTPSVLAFPSEAKGGKLEELRTEIGKDGAVVYAGEVVKNGKETDLRVSAEGKVLERGKTHDESTEPGERGEK